MKNKLKGKCKKCVGCNKIFERNFIGTNKCKYYVKDIKKESILAFVLVAAFEIFVIIAFMFFIYRLLMLSVGG